MDQASKLLLPRGAAVIGSAAVVAALPPRETPLGIVEIPPKNYYL